MQMSSERDKIGDRNCKGITSSSVGAPEVLQNMGRSSAFFYRVSGLNRSSHRAVIVGKGEMWVAG